MAFRRVWNRRELPSKNKTKDMANSDKPNINPSNPQKNHDDKYLSRNDSSEQLKRRHVKHLRGITTMLLKEQVKATSAPFDHSSLNDIKNKNIAKKKGKTVDKPFNSNTSHDNRNHHAPLQTLEPWVEPSPSCNTIVQQSETMTEYTTLCSAFEMLSFDNLCKGENCWSGQDDGVEEFKVEVAHHASAPDFSLVPREISFEKRNIYRSRSLLREEVVIKRHRSKFLKKLLHLKSGRGGGRSTKVSKVKVYVDPPKSNNSIGNSTVTWPSEFQRNSTI